jgi:hypothetical protein
MDKTKILAVCCGEMSRRFPKMQFTAGSATVAEAQRWLAPPLLSAWRGIQSPTTEKLGWVAFITGFEGKRSLVATFRVEACGKSQGKAAAALAAMLGIQLQKGK